MLRQAHDSVSHLQALRLGERAAFHEAPLNGVPLLRDLLRQRPTARLAWLLGVCLGAAGRYGDAIELLTPVAHPQHAAGRGLPADDAAVASLASSTLGSLYRQLGRHEDARMLDAWALELTSPADEPFNPHRLSQQLSTARVDARLGLAADAVGLRELPRAELELAAAIRALPGGGRRRITSPDAWRVRARSCWVRCEVALLRSDSSTALIAARESIRLARAARAPRHEAKGLLFASVAEAGVGHLETAMDVALASMRLSVGLGAWPLVWPAAIILSDLMPAGERLEQVLSVGLAAVELISAGLAEPMAREWRDGADVQRLLARASVPN
jgi:hypothetical protein